MRLKTIKQLFSVSLGAIFFLWLILNPPSRKDIGIITDAKQCYQNKKVCKSEAKVFQEELRRESINLKQVVRNWVSRVCICIPMFWGFYSIKIEFPPYFANVNFLLFTLYF